MPTVKSHNIESSPSRNKKITIIAIAILAIVGGVWAVAGRTKEKKPVVPDEFTVKALKTQAAGDPGKLFQQVHQVMSSPDLSDEQRHAIMENVHTVHEAEMDKRLNDYFAATSDADRKAILDRDIDRMQARMKEFEQRRARDSRDNANPAERGPRSADGRGPGQGPPGGPNAGPPGPPGGPPPHGMHRPGGPSRQERKARTETRNPDQHARMHAYRAAMEKRAKERGIQMPTRGPR